MLLQSADAAYLFNLDAFPAAAVGEAEPFSIAHIEITDRQRGNSVARVEIELSLKSLD